LERLAADGRESRRSNSASNFPAPDPLAVVAGLQRLQDADEVVVADPLDLAGWTGQAPACPTARRSFRSAPRRGRRRLYVSSGRNSIVFGSKFTCIRIFGAPVASPSRTARPCSWSPAIDGGVANLMSRMCLTKSEIRAMHFPCRNLFPPRR